MARREYGGNKVSERIGDSLVRMDVQVEERGFEGETLMGMTIQTPWKRGDDWMVVLRANFEGEPMVAFHTADTLYEVMRGVAERFVNKSLEWKEDEYAKGNR